MHKNCIDIVGQSFGRLKVLERSHNEPYHGTFWVCRCDCGNIVEVSRNRLVSGTTKSCGCLRKEIASKSNLKHGATKTKLYGVWMNMKYRCYYPSCKGYKNYGERGITVCDEWLGEHGFENFRNWCLSNGYKENLTLDRINNDKGDFPDNCRFVDRYTQSRNRRNCFYVTYHGRTKTLTEWSKELDLERHNLKNRILEIGDSEKAIDSILESKRHQTYHKRHEEAEET